MPRKKVIIIKPFIFTGQYMLPGDVRHEIRPIRMRYLQSDFCAREQPFSRRHYDLSVIFAKLKNTCKTNKLKVDPCPQNSLANRGWKEK